MQICNGTHYLHPLRHKNKTPWLLNIYTLNFVHSFIS